MSERDIFGEDSGEVPFKAPPPPPPEEPGAPGHDRTDAKTHLRDEEVSLLQWHGEGKKIIAVIGFYDSGKTFYVNRLRKILPDHAGWFCKQKAQDNAISVTPDGILLTEITRAGRKHFGYIIADVAGESFAKAFKSQMGHANRKEPLDINPRYLSIFALADAFILLLPANDLGAGEDADFAERKQDNRDMIESFHNIVGMIKCAHDRITVQGETPRGFIEHGVTGEELSQAFFKHHNTCARPVSILFSQADVYRSHTDDHFDEDPFLFTFQHLPKLAHAINHFFDYYRFDFLSAFCGQEGNVPDYDLPHHGARESFYWIHDLLETRRGLWARWKHSWKGHLPTRTAIKWRRRMDPNFRDKWKELKG